MKNVRKKKKVLIKGILRGDLSTFSKISNTILLFNDNIVLIQTGSFIFITSPLITGTDNCIVVETHYRGSEVPILNMNTPHLRSLYV